MEKLPNEIIIFIINKLNLCKFNDNNIKLVSKIWYNFYNISTIKCKKIKILEKNYCNQHIIFDICTKIGYIYDSTIILFSKKISNFLHF